MKEKTIKAVLKIKDNKAYSVFEETNEWQELNGCEERRELAVELSAQQLKVAEIEKQLEVEKRILKALKEQDNILVGCGYCRISQPVYKRTGGVTVQDNNGNYVIEAYEHEEDCLHKKAV